MARHPTGFLGRPSPRASWFYRLLLRAPDVALPQPWSADERSAAHRIVAELYRRTAPTVAEAHAATELPAGSRKRWTWLTTAWH